MKSENLPLEANLGYLLNKATRRLRLRLAEALASAGLTPQQAAVLFAVAQSEGQCLTPRAIAESVETDPATMSGLIERMTRDGWIESTSNPADRRSRLIRLTAKAKEALPQAASAADAVTAEAVACLSADEVQSLSVILSKLCAGDIATGNKSGGLR